MKVVVETGAAKIMPAGFLPSMSSNTGLLSMYGMWSKSISSALYSLWVRMEAMSGGDVGGGEVSGVVECRGWWRRRRVTPPRR